MQVSVTATGGLERRLEVAIPASKVDGEVAQRLNKISRTARAVTMHCAVIVRATSRARVVAAHFSLTGFGVFR